MKMMKTLVCVLSLITNIALATTRDKTAEDCWKNGFYGEPVNSSPFYYLDIISLDINTDLCGKEDLHQLFRAISNIHEMSWQNPTFYGTLDNPNRMIAIDGTLNAELKEDIDAGRVDRNVLKTDLNKKLNEILNNNAVSITCVYRYSGEAGPPI